MLALQHPCDLHGDLLCYFPAYSPNSNLIEVVFHLSEQLLQRHSAMAPEYGTNNNKKKFGISYLPRFDIFKKKYIIQSCSENGTLQ